MDIIIFCCIFSRHLFIYLSLLLFKVYGPLANICRRYGSLCRQSQERSWWSRLCCCGHCSRRRGTLLLARSTLFFKRSLKQIQCCSSLLFVLKGTLNCGLLCCSQRTAEGRQNQAYWCIKLRCKAAPRGALNWCDSGYQSSGNPYNMSKQFVFNLNWLQISMRYRYYISKLALFQGLQLDHARHRI